MFKSALLSLLAAASQAKKDALAKKYQLPIEFVEKCANVDPTHNGQFTDWLVKVLRHYQGDWALTHYLEELPDALTEFIRVKNNLEWSRNGLNETDINKYVNVDDFLRMIEAISPEDYSKKEKLRDLQRRKQKYLKEGCEEVGSPREGFTCFKPTTVRAAQIMGEGSHWCTKGSYADRYMGKGALYIFVMDEKGGDYDSDRYAQVFSPDDSATGFEFQDVDGTNLGRSEAGGKCYKVDDDHWWMIEWLKDYDSDLAGYVSEGYVFNDYDDMIHFEECDECSGTIDSDTDDGLIYISEDESPDGGSHNFCCERCFKNFYADIIEEKVTEIIAALPSVKAREEKAAAITEEFLYGTKGDKKAKKVITAMHEAAIKLNLPNTVEHHYDASWYMSNIESGIRAFELGKPEVVEKVTPGLTAEDYKWAKQMLQPIIEGMDAVDRGYSEAAAYVYKEFCPADTNIEEILRAGGFLDSTTEPMADLGELTLDESEPETEPPTKPTEDRINRLSSVKSALLKTAAASEAKKKALAEKYGLPVDQVEDLANKADPTTNGAYLDWLCREARKFLDTPGLPGEDTELAEAKTWLERYILLKRSDNFTGEKDIMKLSLMDLKEIYDAASRADLSKKEQERELLRNRFKYLQDGCEPLAQVNGYSFYRCTTPEALVLMSEGSHWCTQGEGTAEAYLERGPLYVVTQDTGTNDQYGSDRYALIRVPVKNITGQGVGSIECQDVNGRNIGDQIFDRDPFGSGEVGQKYDVDGDYWWIFTALAEFDPKIKELMDKKIIFPGAWEISNDDDLYGEEEQEVTNCSNCDEVVAENDAIYISGNPYCCSNCLAVAFRPAVNRIITKFLSNSDTDVQRRAMAYIEEQIGIGDYDDLDSESEKILIRGGFCQKCQDCHEAIPAGKEIEYRGAFFCNLSCFITYHMQDIDEAVRYIEKKLGMGEEISHFVVYDEKIAERAIRNEKLGIDEGFYKAAIAILKETNQITEQQVQQLGVKKASLLIKKAFGTIEKYYPRDQFVTELQEFMLESLDKMTPLRSFKKYIENKFGEVYHLGTDFKLDKALWDEAMQKLRAGKKVEVVTAIAPYSKAASYTGRAEAFIKRADDSDEIIEETKEEHYGQEVIIDLHDVDPEIFQTHILKKFAEDLCDEIGMQRGPIYSWGQDKFEGTYKTHPKKDGISVVQFLYESSITIHALDELQKIFINVFSCKDFDPEQAKAFALKTLGGNLVTEHNIVRN